MSVTVIAGNSVTPCDAFNCGPQPYGGGLENFPRFLEDWGGGPGGTVFTYRGSLVCLFPSAQSARPWGHALNGGMQRIADKVFMFTPQDVEISAEERAHLIEKGFFNQS